MVDTLYINTKQVYVYTYQLNV